MPKSKPFSEMKPLALWNRSACDQVAPYLVPFSECALDARTHARVAQHLETCQACQSEVLLLGQMGDFFRANPPQTSAPAPNLWKNIEAQIQAETPERIARFANAQDARRNADPLAPTVHRQGFDWRGFSRAFAATGGVMAAAVACVWVVLDRLPVAPDTSPSLSVATASAGQTARADSVSITLLPARRSKAAAIASVSSPATRTGNRAVSGRAYRVAAISRPAPTLLAMRSDVIAPVARPAVRAKSFHLVKSQPVPQQSDTSSVYYAQHRQADLGNRALSNGRQLRGAADSTPTQESADPLNRVATLVDGALSHATVVAVAASLPSTPGDAAETNVARVTLRYADTAASSLDATGLSDGAADQREVSVLARSAPSQNSEAPARRAMQVAWLGEDDPREVRARRSPADALRDARRQQSLFSYGSR